MYILTLLEKHVSRFLWVLRRTIANNSNHQTSYNNSQTAILHYRATCCQRLNRKIHHTESAAMISNIKLKISIFLCFRG